MRVALTAIALASPSAWADCLVEVTTSDVYGHIERAQAAFTNLELDAFKRASDQAVDGMPCLDEPVQRHLSAEVHRLVGLQGAVDRDATRTTQAFAAARSLEPEYRFPVEMVPEGSPVLDDYVAIDVSNGTYDELLKPASGHLQIDGRPGRLRPNAWPAVVQYFDAGGDVVWTKYVWPKSSLPSYPLPDLELRVDPPPPLPDRPPIEIAAAAGGAAILATGLLVGAELNRRRFANPETDDARLPALQKRTNRMVVGSVASTGVALGLGVAVLLTW